MKTYGFRKVPVKIGRKTYEIEAVIVDIDQEILGMDFLNKFKLGLDWEGGEYHIYDRQAQIKKSLTFVAVDKGHFRTQALISTNKTSETPAIAAYPAEHPALAFQVSCMKSLTSTKSHQNPSPARDQSLKNNNKAPRLSSTLRYLSKPAIF